MSKIDFSAQFEINKDFLSPGEDYSKADIQLLHDYVFDEASEFSDEEYDIRDLADNYLDFVEKQNFITVHDYIMDYYRFM